MSEYWVSKKKYWCQYCEIYIADDVPSRSQHENGLRHKGNKDRFVRSLYKAGVKKKQESEEEKREMKRVDEAAQAAYARDIGAGLVRSAPSSSVAAVPAPKPKPPPPKPSDPYANYTTAASLGISDPEVDRLIAEAQIRQSEGRAGDWVAVVPPPPPPPPQIGEVTEVAAAQDVKREEPGHAGDVRKRGDEDDDTRQFKIRRRTVAVGLGEIYDPGVIRITPRVEQGVKSDAAQLAVSTTMPAPGPVLGGGATPGNVNPQAVSALPAATEKPAWTRRQWKWAGEDQGQDLQTAHSHLADATVDAPARVSPDATLRHKDASAAQPDADGEVKKVDPPDSELSSGYAPAGSSEIKKQEPSDSELVSGNAPAGSCEVKKQEPADSELLSRNVPAGSLFRKRRLPAASRNGRRQG